MSTFLTELIGTLAGILSCLTFVPQVVKTWKARSFQGVSLLMFVIAFLSTILWLIYGLLIHSFSVVFTNVIVMVLTLTMLVMRLRF
ncbi:MAG: SemiSWEET family transporter [Saprospiraceae bacterium]|nr:SemiSWEET family transporter [Saprospiraceae bacterium]